MVTTGELDMKKMSVEQRSYHQATLKNKWEFWNDKLHPSLPYQIQNQMTYKDRNKTCWDKNGTSITSKGETAAGPAANKHFLTFSFSYKAWDTPTMYIGSTEQISFTQVRGKINGCLSHFNPSRAFFKNIDPGPQFQHILYTGSIKPRRMHLSSR